MTIRFYSAQTPRVLIILAITLALFVIAIGQGRVPIKKPMIGSIQGSVKTGGGSPVTNANIKVIKTGANAADSSVSGKTNDQGNFVIGSLTPGMYRVTVTAQGFTPQSKSVRVIALQSNRLDFELRP
jgi:hypothetical protein